MGEITKKEKLIMLAASIVVVIIVGSIYMLLTAPKFEPQPEEIEEQPYPKIEEKEYDLNKFQKCYDNFAIADWYSLLICAPVACEMQGYEIDQFPTALDMKIECWKEDMGKTIYIDIPKIEECRTHLVIKEKIIKCIEGGE